MSEPEQMSITSRQGHRATMNRKLGLISLEFGEDVRATGPALLYRLLAESENAPDPTAQVRRQLAGMCDCVQKVFIALEGMNDEQLLANRQDLANKLRAAVVANT